MTRHPRAALITIVVVVLGAAAMIAGCAGEDSGLAQQTTDVAPTPDAADSDNQGAGEDETGHDADTNGDEETDGDTDAAADADADSDTDEAELSNAPGDVFVAPDADGSGTLGDPADLADTLASPAIVPGTTIWLRGGTYQGFFLSELEGTPDAPITVRAFPGEHPVIDGNGTEIHQHALELDGAHTNVIGLEITNTDPTRAREQPGSSGRPTLVEVVGQSITLAGNHIHDGGNCIGVWSEAESAAVVGNVISNCGWQGPDRGHGHGIYVQNDGALVRIEGNIILDNFGYGIHGFTANGTVSNLRIANNIIAGSGSLAADQDGRGILVGGATAIRDIAVHDNVVVDRSPAQFGYTNPDNAGLTVTGNTLVSIEKSAALTIRYWDGIVVEDNTLVTELLAAVQLLDSSIERWDGNQFHGENLFQRGGFAAWQEQGRDQTGNYDPEPPTDQIVIVPDTGDAGRTHLAVLAWSGADTIAVDLSAILEPGEHFEIRNAQNLEAAPLAAGTYDGTTIELPLDDAEARQPTGLDRRAETIDGFRALVVVEPDCEPAAQATGTDDSPA